MGKRKTTRTGEYKPVAQQFKEGAELLVVPLDYKILEKLPDEGTLMGGLVPLGETARNLGATFELDSALMTGRLNAMRAIGLVKVVTLARANRGERGWQRTPLGLKALREWQKLQPKEDA